MCLFMWIIYTYIFCSALSTNIYFAACYQCQVFQDFGFQHTKIVDIDLLETRDTKTLDDFGTHVFHIYIYVYQIGLYVL